MYISKEISIKILYIYPEPFLDTVSMGALCRHIFFKKNVALFAKEMSFLTISETFKFENLKIGDFSKNSIWLKFKT